MAFPLHHCHKSCRWLVALGLPYHGRWSWEDRTDDTASRQTKSRRVTNSDRGLLTTRSKMLRQHLKCNLTAPRRAGTIKLRIFFLFLFTQPAVWAWETWYSVIWASQSTCLRHDLQRLWYLANCRLLFIFNLSNAESRGTWKGWRTFAWMNWLSCGDTDFFLCLGHMLFFLCFSSPARVAFGWNQKKKKLRITKSEPVDRRCRHARNTCASRLHLQTRLSGRRNFFTVIARRKKNFLLLRSWMEVDDRVNVSNHYSKKHDARHSCTFAKALKHLNALLRELCGSKWVTLSSHWKPKAKILSVEIIEGRLCW